ncbi:MAG: hypothetical protein CUN55_15655, partial [Phototrophicales bacterium]
MTPRGFHEFDSDDYEEYAAAFDPLKTDRQARRKRKLKPHHTPKKSREQQLAELADVDAIEAGLNITYTPARHEAEWLASSLQTFFLQDYIRDVLAKVKGGKEANVYRCEAAPHIGMPFLAAKVYRPRMFRNLRQDHRYREGRQMLDEAGKFIKNNEQRILRALHKKTSFGEQVSHTSWLMYEYRLLQELYAAGGAVPKPVAIDTNAVLMAYIGDADMPAPTLNNIELSSAEAQRLFNVVLLNIELMLQRGWVHGDLSAYNILYWEDTITIIDFPQVVEVVTNTQADHIFKRDVERVCDYFSAQGVGCDFLEIAAELWDKHVGFSPNERL